MRTWTDEEARQAFNEALGGRPEWWDFTSPGVTMPIGRMVLAWKQKLGVLENEVKVHRRVASGELVGPVAESAVKRAMNLTDEEYPEGL